MGLFARRFPVSVYQCWKENDVLSDYWVAAYPGVNWNSDLAFDTRELVSIAETLVRKYEELFPGDELRQQLAYNIDIGRITEIGWQP